MRERLSETAFFRASVSDIGRLAAGLRRKP